MTNPPDRQLLTDAHCQTCGYNLRGQFIVQHQDTDFVVCRCPECAQFHPAGYSITPFKPWLSQATIAAPLLKACVYIWLLIVTAMGMYWLQRMFLQEFLMFRGVTIEPKTTDELMQNVFYGAAANPWWFPYFPYASGFFFLAFPLGIFVATAFWSRRYPITLAIFCILAIFASRILEWRTRAGSLMPWIVTRIGAWALYSVSAFAIGYLLGRPLARGMVRLFFAPHYRQQCAFLWFADGKPMPDFSRQTSSAKGVLARVTP